MTGTEIFTTAVAFLEQSYSDSTDMTALAVRYLNVLSQEIFDTENRIRGMMKKDLLPSAPLLAALDDNIDYCDDLCRVALPYGLASFFYANDDENGKAQDYRARYVNALNEAIENACRQSDSIVQPIDDFYRFTKGFD